MTVEQYKLAFFWLVLFIILLIIELITLGLTTIWFAAGAMVAMCISLLGGDLIWQIVAFVVVSVVVLIFVRPISVKYLNKNKTKTNVDVLVGQKTKLTKQIVDNNHYGEVFINGESWMAKSEDGSAIDEDADVEVVGIEGVKLIVKKI